MMPGTERQGRFRASLNWVLAANLATGGLNFLAGAWFARHLGPGAMGAYVAVSTAILLLGGCLSPGFDQALIRAPESGSLRAAGVRATHLQAVLVALLALLLYLGVRFGAGSPGGMSLEVGIPVLGGVLAGFYANLLAAPLAARLDYRFLAVARLGGALIGVGAGLGMAWAGQGALALAVRDLAGALGLLALVVWRSPLAWGMAGWREGLPELIRFTLPLWGLTLLEKLIQRIDYALVGILFGLERLGIYFALRMIVEGALAFVVNPIQTVVFAHACAGQRAEGGGPPRILPPVVPFWGAALVVLPLLAWAGPPLVQGVLGPKYQAAGALVPGFALLAVSTVWFELVKVSAMARNTHAAMLPARLFQLVLYVPLVAVLSNRFNLAGAAWAAGAASLGLALAATVLARRAR